ncbi:MAG: hypothetical protein ACOZQL_32260, partial [Myxococcota bacterium]
MFRSLLHVSLLGFVVGVTASTLSSCGASKCDSHTCAAGCCDLNGQCQLGSSGSACGIGGAACTTCSLLTTCQFGVCVAASVGGGSGSTGGGGGSTGGN